MSRKCTYAPRWAHDPREYLEDYLVELVLNPCKYISGNLRIDIPFEQARPLIISETQKEHGGDTMAKKEE